jgi:hypothetical protein
MPVERKSAIRKAPAADVVDVLTSRSDIGQASSAEPSRAESPEPREVAPRSSSSRRPGPGRPRSKRRMEPFSSKIEIELRDEMDDYVAEHGLSIIDFLDEAVRDRLKK